MVEFMIYDLRFKIGDLGFGARIANRMDVLLNRVMRWGFLLLLVVGLVGCGGQEVGEEKRALTRVRLQTDWYPQPEHGGFYQALAKGFYEEEGLAVELLPGGPNAMTMQKVLRGDVEFSMHRADHVIQKVAEGIPLVMLFAHFQNDPQALMYHASNPLTDLSQLANRPVVAVPGLSWIAYVENLYSIRLRLQPHDFGMVNFMSDPNLVQQCLITNEPFYVKQTGLEVGVFRLSDTGFNPYHVVYGRKDYVQMNPEICEAFKRASIRGWLDYLLNDPAPAHALILERNAMMSVEQMDFARQMLIEQQIVTGNPDSGDSTGRLRKDRLGAIATKLYELGIIRGVPAVESYLPKAD